MSYCDFSVVMPVFNEGKLVIDTVDDLMVQLKDEQQFEVILVDDGSADDTWASISLLCARYRQLRGLKFTRNFGHQAALLAGVSNAKGRAVITMDSDGEHPVTLVPTMLNAWRSGVKVVQPLRKEAEQLSFFKRFSSKSFYNLFSWLAQTSIRPGSADFRLLDREVVEVILAHPNASAFMRGFVPWTGYRTEYLPFEQGTRASGVSKFTGAKMMALARKGIIGFSVKPLRLSMLLGVLTCIFSLINLIYSVAIKFISPETVVPGWTTVTGLLALIGGVQLLVMGILGEYIGVIFETLRQSPPFLIDRREGYPQPIQTDDEADGVGTTQAIDLNRLK